MRVQLRANLQRIVTCIRLVVRTSRCTFCVAFAMAAVIAVPLNLLCDPCTAADINVQVNDRTGKPVKDVVVTVSDGRSANPSESRNWVMDQLDMRFAPQVLIVPVHAAVKFPNSDSVSHQVYSFSKAKSFQLPLYKGHVHSPIVFDTPGLVVLGCNIHDEMIGYIYVTAARWFGKTDDRGELNLQDINASNVTVKIWSPYISDNEKTLSRELVLSSDDVEVKFGLEKPLRSTPEPRPRNPEWDY